MNKYTRHLVVKDITNLEKYGFKKEDHGLYYFYTGNNGKYGSPIWTISIREEDKSIYVCSHGNITLEVICKMYVDGVLEFEDNRNVDKRIFKAEMKIKQLEEQIKRLKEGKW